MGWGVGEWETELGRERQMSGGGETEEGRNTSQRKKTRKKKPQTKTTTNALVEWGAVQKSAQGMANPQRNFLSQR